MILTSFAIALIAIVFGAKLLAQSQKDNLGVLYKYLAWFIIIMGFCVLMCDGVQGLFKMCHRGQDRTMHCEMRMRGDDGMMGGGPMWMGHHNGNMCNDNNCCNGNMNCCDKGNCSDGNMSCHDGNGGMGAGCPMMNGGMNCKVDSARDKK